jgi:hypothetical protein
LVQLLAAAEAVRKQLARLHAAAAKARTAGSPGAAPKRAAAAAATGKGAAAALPRGPGNVVKSASESARESSSGEKGRRLSLELEMARLSDDAAATTQAVPLCIALDILLDLLRGSSNLACKLNLPRSILSLPR